MKHKLDGSTLTVVLSDIPAIGSPEYKILTDNIWETHKNGSKLFGSDVTCISWGDVVRERDKLQVIVETFIEEFGNSLSRYRHKELIELLDEVGIDHE